MLGEGVGADLVGHVAGRGGAVGPDDDEVDLAAAEQVAHRAVGDEGVGDAVLAEFPGSEARALEAGTGLPHPDVDAHAFVVGEVDGRGRGAPVDGG